MNYYIDWDVQPLEVGDYRLELSIENEDYDWAWSENFTVEEE